MLLVYFEEIETRLGVDGRELLESLIDMLVVLVVFKVELKNTPKPTMMMIVMIMRADTPRDIALFAFTNSNRIQK